MSGSVSEPDGRSQEERPPPAAGGYSLYAVHAPDVITVTSGGVYRFVSPACRRLFGWEPADLEGNPERRFVNPDDTEDWEAGYSGLDRSAATTSTYRHASRNGDWRWVEATRTVMPAEGEVVVVSTLRDVTERWAATAALLQRSLTDPLTGVGNRTLLSDRLNQALRRMNRSPGALAVIYLDLDRFKRVNDSASHLAGDLMLVQVARRLAADLRPSDTLARMGGDEFVVLAESVADARAAMDLANRLIGRGREPVTVDGREWNCTISAGVAFTTDPGSTEDDLLYQADLALYRAKRSGRDRVEAYDPERDGPGRAPAPHAGEWLPGGHRAERAEPA